MTIANDMQAPLTEAARVRAYLAMDPATRRYGEMLGAAVSCLEECAQRIEALERAIVPPHWLHQHAPVEACAGVVSLAEARARRQQARAVRL